HPATASVMAHYFRGQGLGIPSVLIPTPDEVDLAFPPLPFGANETKGAPLPTALEAEPGGARSPTLEALSRPAGCAAARAERRRRLVECLNSRYVVNHPDAEVKAWDRAWRDAHAITEKGAAAKAFDLAGKPLLPGGPNARAPEIE